MMKCDMCYDRSSVGKKPMCATVCPSGALWFGTREAFAQERPRSQAVNQFRFGGQTVATKVNMVVPRAMPVERLDVTEHMNEPERARSVRLVIMDDAMFEPAN